MTQEIRGVNRKASSDQLKEDGEQMKSHGFLFILLFLAAQIAFSETIVFSKSGYQTQEVTAVAGDTNISVSLVALTNDYRIPLSWDDPIFTGMTEITGSGFVEVGTGASLTRYSVDPNPPGLDVVNDPSGARIACRGGGNLVTYCRLRGREGWRISGMDVTIENTYCEVAGNQAVGDHADGLQVYNGSGINGGTLTMRNSAIVADPINGTGRETSSANAAFFSSDDSVINIVIENCYFSGGAYTFRARDGVASISMRNVFIELDSYSYGGIRVDETAGGYPPPTCTVWENVRYCTVTNGVIVPGAPIPPPYYYTGP